MTNQTAKMKAFNLLKQQKTPVALPAFLTQLGGDYTERTLRRWLAEWVLAGEVQKSGQKRSTVYWVSQADASTERYFTLESEQSLAKIKTPYRLRPLVSYRAAWLTQYQPNKTHYLSDAMVKRLQAAGDRSNHQKPAGTYAKQIYQRLLIDLAYNSSRLEGNTYSLLDTKRLLMEGVAAPGKLNEEKTMILNHQEAIRFIVDKRLDKKLDEQSILTLHYLLSDGLVAPDYAGQVRDHGVRIGGSAYLPLENPKQDVQAKKIAAKEDVSQFIQNAREDLATLGPLQLPGLGVTPKELQVWLDGEKGRH